MEKRIEYLDYCKGIAIILVVAGHYFPSASPELWETLRSLIYSFHMPVFFFVSGFLFCKEMAKAPPLLTVTKKKMLRLGIPFLSVACIFLIIKILASTFLSLEHAVTASSISNILLNPVNSFAPLLWFLQALFIIFVLFAVLRITFKRSPLLIFMLALILCYIKPTQYLSLNNVFFNLQFFSAGFLFNEYNVDSYIRRKTVQYCITAIFIFNLTYAIYSGTDQTFHKVFSAYIGIFFTVAVSMYLSKNNNICCQWIQKTGFYSMGIYLLHPFFESAVRIVYYQILKLPAEFFWFGLLAGIFAGTVPCAFIEALVLRRYSITRKYILGLSS